MATVGNRGRTPVTARPGPHPAPGPGVGRSESWWQRRQRAVAPYLFISPFYLLYVAFMLIPVAVALYLSCTEWAGLGTPIWVGAANYRRLLFDPVFFASAQNTLLFVLVSVGLVVPAALLVAQALNTRGLRLRDLFRLTYFTPVVIPPIIITLVFSLLFEREFGLLNAVLEGLFGWGGINWLGDPLWAKATVSFLILWRWTGYLTIFFLAGMQSIPRELYEAASLDGAGPIQKFRNVTLPLLRPVTAFVAVTVMVGSAQIFEEPYLLTSGGPGDATISVAMFIYQYGFERQQLGYAAAAGVVMFVAVFLLGRLGIRIFGVGRES